MRKRVPAAVLAVLLAWSMAAPALAAEEGGTEYVSQDTFWNWLSGNTSGILHKQSVTMQYDDTGQLIQQGYTIYQCVACGEQYKSQDGTGPPGGSSDGGEEEGSGLLDKLGELLGSGAGGFLKLVAAFLGGILDGLIALVNVIVEKLGEVIAAVNQIFLEVRHGVKFCVSEIRQSQGWRRGTEQTGG